MRRWAVVVACCAALAGCTEAPEPDEAPPGPAPTETSPATGRSGGEQVPLVFAVHPTREVSPVREAAARRLLRQSGERHWSAIGQPGGEMRVVTAPGVDAAGARAADSAASARAAARTDDRTLALLPADAVDPTVRVLRVGGVHPLREPDAYPLRTRGAAPASVATVTVVGDLMLGRRVREAHPGRPTAALRPLAGRLAAADVTVGNLESTLSAAGAPTQDDAFAADPSVGAGLRKAGFDVLSMANNHVGDFGETALRQTLRRVHASGIASVGAGPDRAAARSPVVIEANGTRIGFYATDSIGETPAATAETPGTNRLDMPPRTGPLDRGALREVTGDLRRLAKRVEVVVVLPHWGTQYTHLPEPSQRRVARAFARAGADVVAGGHPHWVQGWERIGGATVIHSLGNFVFDMDFSRQTQEGVFVEITLWDGEVRGVEPVPYVIGRDFAPRRARGDRAARILGDVRSTSTGPYAAP